MSVSMLIVLVVVVVAVILMFIYNNLVSKKNSAEAAWAIINVQLQRRYDLIPNLVESVKGYMSHEKSVFEEIAKLRSAFQNTNSIGEMGKIESKMGGLLSHLFAVSENYPELKASANFGMLQEELTSTENKVAYSRQGYNNTVREYNIAIQKFPAMLVAGMFGFKDKDFFEIETLEAKNAPHVNFNS